jgi:hypothetical protein
MKATPVPLLLFTLLVVGCSNISIEGQFVEPTEATATALAIQPAPTSTPDLSATAAIERAVRLTLTAAVPSRTDTPPPSPTNTPPSSPTAEPTTAIPPTETPTPTATKKPAVPPTSAPALTNADSIAGNWTGNLDNTSVRIDLFIQTGCTVGNVCGTASAPLCSVSIALVAINGNTFAFVEQFMSGDPNFCPNGGYEYLRLRPDGTLSYTYRLTSPSGETTGSTATLRRP